MNENNNFDIFSDGMRIFLDYIQRQFKKNPKYLPHPLIRAFECATKGINSAKVGERFAGVSQDGTPDNVCNSYMIILEKKESGVLVCEIRNLRFEKTVTIDIMLIVFRLQILMDRIEGECVTPAQMVVLLNEVIPGNRFYALGDRWKEARDEFKCLIESRKVSIPNDPTLISELTKITYDMKWEDYSGKVRAFIGSFIAQKDGMPAGTIIITSPKEWDIEKYTVCDHAIEFLLGKTSEYLNIQDCKNKKV